MAAISCFNVSRSYGDQWAVRNLDFQIGHGSIFALVGPNGAGKSSTIKMLATLLEPTAGRILIDGFDTRLEPVKVRARIGYLPDHFNLYEDMSVEACLSFFGSCFEMSKKARTRRIGELLELLDLQTKKKTRIKDLSRGMKQRVGIGRALIHSPPVLLLDEPASGLDPAARVRLRQMLLRLKEEGITILISSHILLELSAFCDSMAIMQQGRVLEMGAVDEIQARLGGGSLSYCLEVIGGIEIAIERLEDLGAHTLERVGSKVKFRHSANCDAAADLLEDLVRHGVRVVSMQRGEKDMEWVYKSISTNQVS